MTDIAPLPKLGARKVNNYQSLLEEKNHNQTFGYFSPLMESDKAAEIAKRCNAYPKLVAFVKFVGTKEGYKLLEELGEL
jgi:hypothetical protein